LIGYHNLYIKARGWGICLPFFISDKTQNMHCLSPLLFDRSGSLYEEMIILIFQQHDENLVSDIEHA